MTRSEAPFFEYLTKRDACALARFLSQKVIIERNIKVNPDALLYERCLREAKGDKSVADTLFEIRRL
ncbi:hypothetical protein A3C25_04530 [Candidatus Roizmanbacteria bacterium RIFCSPHIGHO2_02_FULL_38_11]|uniref:Uncharacterized protein n=1 Tax=Candidatus Roizmanbacteria bacterium RIFCSPHIGHO2_02_FULL_38_11 TaxID=1802039 RepID=A0A1F7GYM4_9BACT|nr:MAG: hypothetical protein A3C25_04530 [Candidatus Roizmanbacteria bacterium RIFCSPHIGHO2_02_FULL_38_11]